MTQSNHPARPKVEYVIFDMDGLLIDSETVYTHVTNLILAPYGKEMTWDIKAGLMGKPDREASVHLLSHFPDIPLTVDDYLSQRNAAQDALWPTVRPLPGAHRLVRHLHAHGVPIALATSTKRRHFLLKTAHLQAIFACFEDRLVCGDDIHDGSPIKGKPAPDIYLIAAKEKLGLDVGSAEGGCGDAERDIRGRGLVFEDAISGVQAAKRAGMSVVWVPDDQLLGVDYSAVEKPDLPIKSLEEFVPEEWGLPPYTDSKS